MDDLEALIRHDAEAAWPRLIEFVSNEPDIESVSMMELFLQMHADKFAERVEREARRTHRVAEVVAEAYLGDVPGRGAERLRRFQDALFKEGRVGSRWSGYVPFRITDYDGE